MEYIHELTMKVRDYECDIQGIVNNANYQHYLEHARHEYLQQRGVSFAKLHEDGIDAVVSKITMRFKIPLRSNDTFIVKTAIKREGIRYVFYQDIFRCSDMKLSLKAEVDIACIVKGKLTDGEILKSLL